MEQVPLILRMDLAKNELMHCVNDILQKYGLNCYLLEPSFAEAHSKIKATAQSELAQARAQVEAANAVSNDEN